MQLCSNCGAELPDGARFCGNCGRVFRDKYTNQQPPSAETPLRNDDNSYPVKRHARQPYSYAPPSAFAQPPAPAYMQDTSRVPDRPPTQRQPGAYPPSPTNRAMLSNQQPYPPPSVAQSPMQPPSQNGASKGWLPFRRRNPSVPRRRRGCLIGCLGVLVIFVILGVILVPMAQRVLAFGSAISTQSPLSTQTGYMTTGDRINFLILGYGGAGHDGAYLTDSLVVMSLIPSTHHTTLVSVPRDLWVQYPPISNSVNCVNNCTKINAIYTIASKGNADPVAGGDAIAREVSLVTGLQVNYWLTINFSGFKDFIDAIGGIDVNVPDSFNACYPKNDDASVNASWIKVQFNKGPQHMNGARAIEYARAREPLEVCGLGTSENQAELTDFGRSQRQQLIMQSAFAKLKDWHNWLSLYNALGTLQKTLYTNFSLADLAGFALHMDLTNAHRIGLNNDNVLVDAVSNDGQDILQPRKSWQDIANYVQHGLYG